MESDVGVREITFALVYTCKLMEVRLINSSVRNHKLKIMYNSENKLFKDIFSGICSSF